MAKLQLKNLNKTYSPKVVPVKDISLDVSEGEFLTLLGPSGCGKSTTLRLIAGLEQPTRGEIRIGDRNVTSLRPGDRDIAMVFQSYALYPHMTVYENMASGLKLRKISSHEINRLVMEVAASLGLTELVDRKPGKLSGGQRQRVALGRALVRQPEVFLLDEPLSNLDALLREKVRAELKQLFSSQKAPVVYVTHDQTEAMTLSTKVAVLNSGNVQQLDPPHLIYNRPANLFVAGFVGSPQMNLLELKCQGNSAMLGNFKVLLPNLTTVPPEIVLGIRPEHVCFAGEDAGNMQARPTIQDVGTRKLPAPEAIQGEVYLVENLGMQNLVSVRVKGLESVTVRLLLPNDRLWNSEIVELVFWPQFLHWFDVKTGDRLQ
ncbi:ABC transporter ATP-binding protein [Microcoleus sp. LEGE 07076]|uniref:ABC transporter ATP-binding protein n=1 Tax=Microcoleus sp. LEGE 07076 TaxID=915322 RepID=UPI00188060D8|nr:ABC transporter ATP-binding protein [Microcoleus sp. LEGE 07076]MBE9187958.1 ABC transporter ATP-binding protein [Microcoleus sp. LEGE 07076]